MEQTALYRKYRPKTFDEVIGQDNIVKTLKNQVENKEVGHAYLFCGTRGTGKTSCARLFAKAINCEYSKNGSPCGECAPCKNFGNDGNLDIVEIDAASNNRVDEIRELREKIKYAPTTCKYKVYIIDEVHMLTESAFNALLKTLEEPPAYAVFILATTEPQKLPKTILSRCMKFDFKLVSENLLAQHLKNIFAKEGITCDEESLMQIALAGQGSVRDTLSIAQMVVAYCNKNITLQKCLECIGSTDYESLNNLLSSIINKDVGGTLIELNGVFNSSKNVVTIVKNICEMVKNILIIKLSPNAKDMLKLTNSDYSLLEKLSKGETALLVAILKALSSIEAEVKFALNPEILVESTIISVLCEQDTIISLQKRIEKLETAFEVGAVPQKTVAQPSLNNVATNQLSTQPVAQAGNTQSAQTNILTKTNEQSPFDSSAQQLSTEIKDADKLFGLVLKHYRTNKNNLMYAVCREVVDVKLSDNTLNIFVENANVNVLNEKMGDIKNIIEQNGVKVDIKITAVQTTDKVKRLKEIFGDKLKVIEG